MPPIHARSVGPGYYSFRSCKAVGSGLAVLVSVPNPWGSPPEVRVKYEMRS